MSAFWRYFVVSNGYASDLDHPRELLMHTGRKPGFRSKNRVAVPHNGIREGKIEIPELHDIIPGGFGKDKRVRVKLKEVGYESILIGGMTAGVTR